MSVADISHAIQSIDFLTYIRESPILYPVIMSTHLACIAAFGGMILVTDLRLLGLTMTEIPLTDLMNGLRKWKILGLLTILTCGLLLATSEMDKYYANPYFLIKISMLLMAAVHAIVFRRSVYANTVAIDKQPTLPGVAKLAGLTSMIIWITIFSMGRWIAYYEPPERRPGAENRQTMIQHLDRGTTAQAARAQTPPNAAAPRRI